MIYALPKNILMVSIVAIHTSTLLSQSTASDWVAYGLELHAQEQFERALIYFEHAKQIDPLYYNADFHRANTLLSLGRIDDAVCTYDQLLAINSSLIPVLYNKGYTLKCAGRLDEAIAIYHLVLAHDPSYDNAHLSLGFAYVQKGDFKRGWRQHERYLIKAGKNGDALRTLLYDNTIAGKRIVLCYEGGLGDTLQFVRYAKPLHDAHAHITVVAQRALLPLLSRCPYIDQLTDNMSARNDADAWAPLLSLPAIVHDYPALHPTHTQYLHADETLIAHHKPLVDHSYFNVGICWQASVANDASRLPMARRGIPLSLMLKLAYDPRIRLYSLQAADGLEQADADDAQTLVHYIHNLDQAHGQFMDSAAIMHHLDLIITIDSAVAHLAGGLGRPVWLLLPYSTDWRWLSGRSDSPWYPTMRIFKCSTPFGWDQVIDEVDVALQTYIT